MSGITYTTYERLVNDFDKYIKYVGKFNLNTNSDADAFCKRVDKQEEKIRRKNEKRTTNKFIAHLSGQYPDAKDKHNLLNKYVPKLSAYQRKCRYRTRKVR